MTGTMRARSQLLGERGGGKAVSDGDLWLKNVSVTNQILMGLLLGKEAKSHEVADQSIPIPNAIERDLCNKQCEQQL